jgi:adenosylcobinamide-phosphate synthase
MDWVPTRLTAAGFAIVGNFEQAAYAWRFHQKKWATQSEAILIGTGGGALGVRLGSPLAELDSRQAMQLAENGDRPVQEFGAEPMREHLVYGASLVWRAIVLWMILLAMLTVAVWIGPL